MKLKPVTKIEKRNTSTSTSFDDDVISVNCDVTIFFPIYGQFGAIREPDSGRMVCKTYNFINSDRKGVRGGRGGGSFWFNIKEVVDSIFGRKS